MPSKNIWQPIETDPDTVLRVRVVPVAGKAAHGADLTPLRDKVLECVPKGSKFYPFRPDTSMLPTPGTDRYYTEMQVGVCHPTFDKVDGLIPFHDKQILEDLSIADKK